MRRIIIKEGPLVFLRDVFVMEVFATLIFFAATFLANYEQLYIGSFLAPFIRYDIFLIVVFSIFQITYFSILFLHWYFSHFEITEKELIKKSGLIFRHRKAVSLNDVATVELYQSPWGRWMHHGTIILEHNNRRLTKIRNVSNYDEYIHIIKQMVYIASGRLINQDIRELISEGEGRFLEFKETMRYDARKGEISKEIEKSIVKTIVGFLNAEGGTLLIGVNDEGQIVGLENDYKTLPRKNRDGFENHVNMLIKTMIGLNFSKYVNVRFEKKEEREICIVTVREGHKPAYLLNGDRKEDFFVRVGNSTQPYSISEASEYIKTHWG